MDFLPIIISLAALLFSGISLGWTIYRDVQRPRFKVSAGIKKVAQKGAPSSEPFIGVDAVNLGPMPNKVGLVFVRKSWWQRKIRNQDITSAFVEVDYAHPATSPRSILSNRIEVGEGASYAFPFSSICFLKEDWVQIGVADGYGRMHWAPKDQLAQMRKSYLEKFEQR